MILLTNTGSQLSCPISAKHQSETGKLVYIVITGTIVDDYPGSNVSQQNDVNSLL